MTRKLSLKRIQALEDQITDASNISASAVFGVCDMQKQVLRCWELGADKTPIPSNKEPTILIPERLEKLLFPKRLKIIWGGRGSAKTRTVCSILIERARSFRERVACFREIQDSIADSSYQELADEIERKGHLSAFRLTESRIRVPSKKSMFSFAGLLRNITKIKGKAGGTFAWVEEAENVSRQSWDYLFPTMRAKGSEIWVTFNPREETDPTWADLVEPYWAGAVDGIYEDEHTLIIECNHSHNPWLTDELILERDKMKRIDYDRYLWIWEGKFRKNSDVKVFNGKWKIEEFEPSKDWDGPYFGADFGFANDPSTLIKCYIHDHRLYIRKEAYKVGVELDDMPAFYDQIEGSRDYVIKADCSRPETISHIKRKGFKIKPAEKWGGSVEDGITFMRSFEKIIVHPDCPKTAYEFNAYQYKTDRLTGEVLPIILDKDNHILDGLRYSLDGMIKRKGKGWYDY